MGASEHTDDYVSKLLFIASVKAEIGAEKQRIGKVDAKSLSAFGFLTYVTGIDYFTHKYSDYAILQRCKKLESALHTALLKPYVAKASDKVTRAEIIARASQLEWHQISPASLSRLSSESSYSVNDYFTAAWWFNLRVSVATGFIGGLISGDTTRELLGDASLTRNSVV